MNPSTVSLTDVKQMRALAHPLRLRILGELRAGGPSTAGRLGDLVDEAPGTLSYHLGKLAQFGFVEEAPELSTDRRERWWRALHEYTAIPSTSDADSAAETVAIAALRHRVVDVYAATLHQSVDASTELTADWSAAGTSADTLAHLTAAQLAEASAELGAVLEKWHAASNATGEGAEPVQLIVHAFRRP
ncbi:winged helix-turn-helix domain-containing protein [Conyzicola nivalis]|uniref:Transcriptional regulator n=1 Tax=Conyzicola nivalis TaxID=1477021 RepID=A0A916SKK8_9MICO|nr:helix-turn-helix domain-containing protein [Conyzicola nivalis]GGB05014.1 transcriptional regulator [Conyzicola nivalis]